MHNITTVFLVTELKTGKSYREFIDGCGQEAVEALKKLYTNLTAFFIEGFEVNGKFVPVDLSK